MKRSFRLHTSKTAFLSNQRFYNYIYNYWMKQTDNNNYLKRYNQMKRKISLNMVINGVYTKYPLSDNMEIW